MHSILSTAFQNFSLTEQAIHEVSWPIPFKYCFTSLHLAFFFFNIFIYCVNSMYECTYTSHIYMWSGYIAKKCTFTMYNLQPWPKHLPHIMKNFTGFMYKTQIKVFKWDSILVLHHRKKKVVNTVCTLHVLKVCHLIISNCPKHWM